MTEETVRPEDLKPGESMEIELRFEPRIGSFLVAASTPPEATFHATITRLPPPVDPDLLLARTVVAEDWPEMSDQVLAGELDSYAGTRIALAAIKAAKEQS